MDQHLRDAVLGLDLGSTSTRAIIRTLGENPKYFLVDDNENVLGAAGRFDRSDFSSTGYPFEAVPGPVYRPHATPEDLQDRQPTPLKYAMYLLAKASDELDKLDKLDKLLNDYPAVAHVCAHWRNADFLARMKQGLIEHMVKVLERTYDICRKHSLRIIRICLTIPVSWTLEFEDTYTSIIVEALRRINDKKGGTNFAVGKDDIYFVTEVDALAAYMFDNPDNDSYITIDRPTEAEVQNLKSGYYLFLDFGGHNINGCGIFVKRPDTPTKSKDKPEQIGFFTSFEAFGKGGGSEHWEYLMGQRVDRMLPSAAQPDNSERRKVLDDLNRGKRGWGPGSGAGTRIVVFADGKPNAISLRADEINEDFDKAFGSGLALVFKKLEEFRSAVPTGADCTVVISGGSANNAALQKQLKGAAQLEHLPAPIFTSDFDLQYGSARIAKGAAYAIANIRTVKQFFDEGAAIAIQVRPGGFAKNKSNPSLGWELASTLLLRKGASNVVTLDSDGTDEFRLICDPFFARFREPEPNEEINLNACYNLLFLGRRAAGQWRFAVSHEVVRGLDKLVIETSHRKEAHARSTPAWPEYRSIYVPVHFVAGPNTVIAGQRGKTLDETLKKLRLVHVLPKNPDGSDGREGGEADDVVVDWEDVTSEDEQEEEVVKTCGTRSRPKGGLPQPPGRFTATPVRAAAKKSEGEQEVHSAYEPSDEEEEAVNARGTRSRRNRRLPPPPGRFRSTPMRAAAKKGQKRKADLGYLGSDVE